MTAALSNDGAAPKAEVAPEARPKPSRARMIILGVMGAAVVAAASWTIAHRGIESTDDAQVEAEVVAVAARLSGVVVKVDFVDDDRVEAGRVLAELDPAPAKARLAQAEASLEAARWSANAAETDAKLAATNAKASNRAAGASLSAASAGASASRDQINEARARVRVADTALAQAKLDFDRVQQLAKSGALSQSQLDQAQSTFETAKANVAQTQANLSVLEASAAQAMSRVGEASAKVDTTRDVDSIVALAEAHASQAKAKVAELEALRDLAAIDLANTKIYAPQAGVVSKKSIAVGQTLAAGTPIAQLVPSSHGVWVTANFKETQIGKMRAGQPVEIQVDTFGSQTFHGSVHSISAATGSRFALLPPDNATGNFTKVVQRVPVRIVFDALPEGVVLRPGMSVELSVDTRK